MSRPDPALRTRVTETYGTRLPIVAGGLMWLADGAYVAACAGAGIMGFLTAASFKEPGALEAEIARARDLTDGPFGVNVSMLPKLVEGETIEATFRTIIDAGIRHVETSGRSPAAFLPMLREAGVHVLHKVPSVRYAESAERAGVDMVAIVGAECGGHPGLDLVGTAVNMALAERRLTIPFLIGGGIGTGGQIVAALANGADGVVIGTRFLVAEELSAHRAYKEALVAATERDTMLTMSSVRNTIRTLANDTAREVATLERDDPEIGIERLMPLVAGTIGREAYRTGDVSRGMLSAGQSLGLADRIAPLAEITAQLEAEAARALARLRGPT
ncbi:NAD(P)H-dependent flavin oxidoreductase [Jannaschia formosa]|uniref:NAD(P)H-dependent flavin oxidoreductase n=1 Tax=Jannaschia formosa TaxID=2259592 RepID=UPI000E1BA952|nr:nitronate monooxygenase [Jannaschia formosa]TFL18058.1 nitronate monooxygenase [Jannaschia formosa]